MSIEIVIHGIYSYVYIDMKYINMVFTNIRYAMTHVIYIYTVHSIFQNTYKGL